MAWERFYTSKLPVTAVHVLNDRVLPFLDERDVRIHTVLSDNGREFCGRPDRHPYEIFLPLEEIEHRTTKVRRPQSNGFIERFYRTLLDEHLRVKGRTTWYESLDEMHSDLDHYLEIYNSKRPHRGRMMIGRTPLTAFRSGIPKALKAAPHPLQPKGGSGSRVSFTPGGVGCQVNAVLVQAAPGSGGHPAA